MYVVAEGGVTGIYGPVPVDETGVWRLELPAFPATTTPTQMTFSTTTGGDSVILFDVLFGDVHLCGGQSNMQFAVANGLNVSAELNRANAYPLIRLFTVGQDTNSSTPLRELATIEQHWSIASAATVGAGPWSMFSAVCWFTYVCCVPHPCARVYGVRCAAQVLSDLY